jgi:hypothetical protein
VDWQAQEIEHHDTVVTASNAVTAVGSNRAFGTTILAPTSR